MRTACIGVVVASIGLASIEVESQSVNPLVGVWRVAEIVAPDGQKQASPQPTIYIFTARHYSHVSVTSPSPRPHLHGPDGNRCAASGDVAAVQCNGWNV